MGSLPNTHCLLIAQVNFDCHDAQLWIRTVSNDGIEKLCDNGCRNKVHEQDEGTDSEHHDFNEGGTLVLVVLVPVGDHIIFIQPHETLISCETHVAYKEYGASPHLADDTPQLGRDDMRHDTVILFVEEAEYMNQHFSSQSS
jgi:hypothetical protein